MSKKFITSISVFLLALVIFTTSATPAFAAMKCESKSEILYYDPIANKKQQDSEAAMIALGLFGSFGATVKVGKLIAAFTSAAGWVHLTNTTPNKKPVKYQLTVTKCIDYDILKKHPFSASIGYVRATVRNLQTGQSTEWYRTNIGYNPLF